MSISVDDLVASLSSNHIGQEAMDIANLQNQLSQTLYQTNQHAAAGWSSSHAPCNTPTARTPISCSWADSHWQRGRGRSSSVASASSRRGNVDLEDDIMEEPTEEDEEYAVEQMVVGRQRVDSASLYPASMSPASTHPHTRYPPQSYASAYGSDAMSTSPTVSTFATTDPFFAAAQASTKVQPQQSSFFAQVGRPSQQSPFFAHNQQQNNGRAVPFPLAIDPRPRYVAAGGLDG